MCRIKTVFQEIPEKYSAAEMETICLFGPNAVRVSLSVLFRSTHVLTLLKCEHIRANQSVSETSTYLS